MEAEWEGKKAHQVFMTFLLINWHLSRDDTETTHGCLSQLSKSVINDLTLSDLLRKGIIWLTCSNHSPLSRESKAAILRLELTERGVERHCLLAWFPCLTHPVFLYNPGLPVQGWHYSQWTVPWHTIHKSRKCPMGFHSGQCDWGILWVEIPSSQVTLDCVQLVTTTTNITSTIYLLYTWHINTASLNHKLSFLIISLILG